MKKIFIVTLFIVLHAGTSISADNYFEYTQPVALIEKPVLEVEFYGSVVANRKITQKPEVSGLIASIKAEEGTPVKEGGKLAEIKDRVYKIQLREARARLRQAESDYSRLKNGPLPGEISQMVHEVNSLRYQTQQLKKHLKRIQSLYRKEMVSQSEFEEAGTNFNKSLEGLKAKEEKLKLLKDGTRQELLDQAQGRVDELRSAMNRLEESLISTIIRAPFDGIIQKVYIKKGSYVTPQTSLWEIIDDSNIYIELEGNSGLMQKVHPGDKMLFRFDVIPGEQFYGEIKTIYPGVDDKTRTFKFRAVLYTKNEIIKDGMFVRARLISNEFSSSFSIPANAVTERKGRKCVVKIEDKKTMFIPIKIIRILSDENIEIKAELAESDKIVLSPPVNLVQGEAINAVKLN